MNFRRVLEIINELKEVQLLGDSKVDELEINIFLGWLWLIKSHDWEYKFEILGFVFCHATNTKLL